MDWTISIQLWLRAELLICKLFTFREKRSLGQPSLLCLDIYGVILVGFDDNDYCRIWSLSQSRSCFVILICSGVIMINFSDLFWQTYWWFLCLNWTVYPDPPHPHRCQQLCQLLQEQALEEWSGPEEARDNSADCKWSKVGQTQEFLLNTKNRIRNVIKSTE